LSGTIASDTQLPEPERDVDPAPASRRSAPRTRRRGPWLWLTSPALLAYAVFFLFPTFASFALSIFGWSGLGRNFPFVGVDNFVELAGSERFRTAIWHNFLIFCFLFVFQCTVSLALAVLLDHRSRLTHAYRTIVFLPVMLSAVATGFIWQILLSPNIGLVNPLLEAIGLEALTQNWLASTALALPVTALATAWQWNGLAVVLLLAGLQSIPRDLQDAARTDGARERQVFRYVTLPHLYPALTVVTVLLFIVAFRAFDLIYVIGGPTGAPDGATSVLGTLIYTDAFGIGASVGGTARMSYAVAEGVTMFVIVGTVATVLLIVLNRRQRAMR
jgi:raffinose/stachyose/melibiose transport system permease protein